MISARISLEEVHGCDGAINLQILCCIKAEYQQIETCVRIPLAMSQNTFVWQREIFHTTKEPFWHHLVVLTMQTQKLAEAWSCQHRVHPSVAHRAPSRQRKTNTDKQGPRVIDFSAPHLLRNIFQSLEISQTLLNFCFKISSRPTFCTSSINSLSSTFFIKLLGLTCIPIPPVNSTLRYFDIDYQHQFQFDAICYAPWDFSMSFLSFFFFCSKLIWIPVSPDCRNILILQSTFRKKKIRQFSEFHLSSVHGKPSLLLLITCPWSKG